MIGLWLDAQDDEVLGRLAAVSASEWDAGHAWREDGETHGCLLCHAFDCRTEQDYFLATEVDGAGDDGSVFGVTERRYMDLSRRFGDARIGHLISERASRILRKRRKVPVSVHVSLNCEPVEVGA